MWQPWTLHGVARFAGAGWGRLLLVQFVFAALAATATAWFLYVAWFPTLHQAVRRLPARSEIRAGELDWTGTSPQLLAEGTYLALVVDLDHAGGVRSPAEVQVEFGRKTVRIISLFGYAEFGYPRGWIIAFNRPELQPWWGAWEPPILWFAAGAVIVGLMTSWMLLAALYSFPASLVAFFANRASNLRASWKLAGAALMPGAALITVALFLYGWGMIDLVGFLTLTAVHLVVGWIYVGLSPLFLPKLGPGVGARGNPFVRRVNGGG